MRFFSRPMFIAFVIVCMPLILTGCPIPSGVVGSLCTAVEANGGSPAPGICPAAGQSANPDFVIIPSPGSSAPLVIIGQNGPSGPIIYGLPSTAPASSASVSACSFLRMVGATGRRQTQDNGCANGSTAPPPGGAGGASPSPPPGGAGGASPPPVAVQDIAGTYTGTAKNTSTGSYPTKLTIGQTSGTNQLTAQWLSNNGSGSNFSYTGTVSGSNPSSITLSGTNSSQLCPPNGSQITATLTGTTLTGTIVCPPGATDSFTLTKQ